MKLKPKANRVLIKFSTAKFKAMFAEESSRAAKSPNCPSLWRAHLAGLYSKMAGESLMPRTMPICVTNKWVRIDLAPDEIGPMTALMIESKFM